MRSGAPPARCGSSEMGRGLMGLGAGQGRDYRRAGGLGLGQGLVQEANTSQPQVGTTPSVWASWSFGARYMVAVTLGAADATCKATLSRRRKACAARVSATAGGAFWHHGRECPRPKGFNVADAR